MSPAVICNAQKSRGRGRCGANAIKGKTKCRNHGGMSTGAPIKHGRYSKSLGRFREVYEASLADKSLLDLAEPIAVIDAMAKRAMERAVEGDTPEFRRRARALVEAAIEAQRVENKVAVDESLADLEKLLVAGVAEDRSAKVLVETCSKLARRIEGALKIKLAEKNVINARDAVALMARFLHVVRREVADPVVSMRIVRCVDDEVLGGVGRKAVPMMNGKGAA